MAAAVNRAHIESAFDSVRRALIERATRPGVLARQLVGAERASDERLGELLINERRARTRMDGSIDGSLVKTAWAALEIMDLGADALHAGLDRLVSWIQTQVETGQPPPDGAPVTLPDGAVVADREGAAFAASCLGLRLLIRARRETRPPIARMIDALADGPQPPTLDLSASALAALALLPPPHRRHLDGLINRLGRAQDAGGGWSDADLFHMLESLVLAGIRSARAVVTRAAPAVVNRLRSDGGFDDMPADDPVREERGLIALRTLHIALED
jgi:hypothetical protein